MSDRPTHWVTQDALEELAHAGKYPIEFGADFAAVVVAEGTEYKSRLTAGRP